MAAKGVVKGLKKGIEKVIHHGTLKTHIPAGMASGSPPLGTQLGQVVFSVHIDSKTNF